MAYKKSLNSAKIASTARIDEDAKIVNIQTQPADYSNHFDPERIILDFNSDLSDTEEILSFSDKTANCRTSINLRFQQISDKLKTRQNQLLAEVDEIEKKYSESLKAGKEIEQLEKVKREQKKLLESALNVLKKSAVINMTDAIKSLDVQIAGLRHKLVSFTNIDIELDTDNIATIIDELGSVKLVESNSTENGTINARIMDEKIKIEFTNTFLAKKVRIT